MPDSPEGYVTRKKRKGKYRYVSRISYRDPITGKVIERTRHSDTRNEANIKLDRLRAEFRKQGYIKIETRSITFAQLASQYEESEVHEAEFDAEGMKTSGLKTHEQVRLYLRVLVDWFGERRIEEIRHSEIAAFRRKRIKTPVRGGGQRSIASVNRELETCRRLFRFAMRGGLLEKNPFDQGERLIIKRFEKKRDRILTSEEEERLLEACTGPRYEPLRLLIIIGVDTGLRRGETLSLKWSDVDLEVERGRIHIRPENEKTNRGRTVSLRDRLKAELVTLWEQSEKQPDGFVFGIRDNFKNSWRTVCRLAGVTNLRYHDLRHTAISRMVKAGVPVSTAMKIAGHTTLGMFNRYHNLTNEDVDMAAAALDKIMDEPPSDRLTDEINQKPDFKM